MTIPVHRRRAPNTRRPVVGAAAALLVVPALAATPAAAAPPAAHPLIRTATQPDESSQVRVADLGVTVTDGRQTVQPGEEVRVTVAVTNSGPVLARYAGAGLSLPPGLEILFVSDNGDVDEYSDVTHVGWDFDVLAPAATRTVEVVYRVPRDMADGTTIEARADAHHIDVEIEPTPQDTNATDRTTVLANPPRPLSGFWYLTDGLAGDPRELVSPIVVRPASTDAHLGDWNGDGIDTPAYREGTVLRMRNSTSSGGTETEATYGRPGETLYTGDFDGDGVDTFAVRRGNEFLVSNGPAGGQADVRFWYGRADDEVLVGDWDGDGKDSFAIRRGNAVHLRNSLSTGSATTVVWFGRPGEPMLVGDFDGDGDDGIAVRRGTQVHVNNSLTSGNATRVTTFGAVDDAIVVGDFDGDGDDTLGVHHIMGGG